MRILKIPKDSVERSELLSFPFPSNGPEKKEHLLETVPNAVVAPMKALVVGTAEASLWTQAGKG